MVLITLCRDDAASAAPRREAGNSAVLLIQLAMQIPPLAEASGDITRSVMNIMAQRNLSLHLATTGQI